MNMLEYFAKIKLQVSLFISELHMSRIFSLSFIHLLLFGGLFASFLNESQTD